MQVPIAGGDPARLLLAANLPLVDAELQAKTNVRHTSADPFRFVLLGCLFIATRTLMILYMLP